ncbi:unnamed protein product [Allacma fusca]|uniref:Peptidase S8/S53 domain-containing protein n=1 Tax=Allacma fusca TaxID=39272 RepID=A0A8J2J0P2_9HEXA|nr:unnamed protein product [Allacma fusca]
MDYVVFDLVIVIALLQYTNIQSSNGVISDQLKIAFEKEKITDVMVTFKHRPSEILSKISLQTKSVTDRGEKLRILSDELEILAKSSQINILKKLKEKNVGSRIRSLWITNQVSIGGASLDLVTSIAALPEVLKIDKIYSFKLEPDQDIQKKDDVHVEPPNNKMAYNDTISDKEITQASVYSWAVWKIQAPEVWEMGYDGQGVVVGIIDSGISLTHDVVYDSFIGTDEYGWFDPNKMGEVPRDITGHGTVCLGHMTGKYGMGVAPSAKWMACNCVDDGWRYREDWVLECFQFMLCPTDHMGNNKNCSRAPRVISNSYNTVPGESGEFFREITKVLVETDIHYVFSIGNFGSFCNSTGSPGNFEEFIGVGLTTIYDEYQTLSSAGPDPTGKLIKPDICAPADMVMSAHYEFGNDFIDIATGTSLSTPIVGGVIALMVQKNSKLSQKDVKKILFNSTTLAVIDEPKICGDTPDDQIPNNRIGWGVVNALKAILNVPEP